jgi:hypothetical protein
VVAKARTSQSVKIFALLDLKIGRHEYMVEPPRLAARHVGDIHCAVSMSFPVGVPKSVVNVVFK